MYEGTKELAYFEEDAMKDKYLNFKVEDEIFAIEIKVVTEIIGILSITKVPEVPPYVMGIINLRGKVIPVIDIRLRFKKPFREYNDRTCIMIIDIQGISIGLIVDRVLEVLTIAEQDIALPPEVKSGFHNRYIRGIGKSSEQVCMILNCDRILSDNELEFFGELSY